MVEQNYEGEVEVIIIEDENGNESYYEEEMIIPYDGKNFAVLVSLPDHEHEEDCDCHFEPEIVIARIEKNSEGVEDLVTPTDEEFNAVLDIFDKLEDEEEE